MAQIKRTKRQATVDKAEHRNSCGVVSIEAALQLCDYGYRSI